MTAAELILKLEALDPETPILVQDSGCGCCQSVDAEGVLIRWINYLGVEAVALMHPDEVRRQGVAGQGVS